MRGSFSERSPGIVRQLVLIPLEEQYFQAFEIEKNCDMRFEM